MSKSCDRRSFLIFNHLHLGSPGVLVTSQEAKLLGGVRRQDLCRLQIWTASPPKPDQPVESPAEVSSVAQSRRDSSVVSFSTPSGFRKSGFSSSSSSSKGYTGAAPYPMPNFVVPGTGGAVYSPPVAPCIVLFAHRVQGKLERSETVRSFVIIDG